MAYHLPNNRGAPFHRRRNLSNMEMDAILMDFATCSQMIAVSPTTNGHIDRTAAYRLIQAHLASMIRIGSTTYSHEGRHEIMQLLNAIRQIRHDFLGYNYQG